MHHIRNKTNKHYFCPVKVKLINQQKQLDQIEQASKLFELKIIHPEKIVIKC
jgi:uncharacterized protein (UPF0305 family)